MNENLCEPILLAECELLSGTTVEKALFIVKEMIRFV